MTDREYVTEPAVWLWYDADVLTIESQKYPLSQSGPFCGYFLTDAIINVIFPLVIISQCLFTSISVLSCGLSFLLD